MSLPEGAARAYRKQAVLTGNAADSVLRALEAAHRAAVRLRAELQDAEDGERLRKFLSLARMGCRTDSDGAGRDLAALTDHLLVLCSHPSSADLDEAIELLSGVLRAFADWRAPSIGGTVVPSWMDRPNT